MWPFRAPPLAPATGGREMPPFYSCRAWPPPPRGGTAPPSPPQALPGAAAARRAGPAVPWLAGRMPPLERSRLDRRTRTRAPCAPRNPVRMPSCPPQSARAGWPFLHSSGSGDARMGERAMDRALRRRGAAARRAAVVPPAWISLPPLRCRPAVRLDPRAHRLAAGGMLQEVRGGGRRLDRRGLQRPCSEGPED